MTGKEKMKRLGLRIDVDTYDGARKGVPALLDLLAEHRVRGTFFCSVGPDNMGRHLLRLFRPRFLVKMLRSRAPGLYGWRIIFRGTLGPGPRISRALAPYLGRAAGEKHEIGLHGLDHHRWQTRGEGFRAGQIVEEIRTGSRIIEDLGGSVVRSFAAPSWRGTGALLEAERELGLAYGSDCRGECLFRPLLAGRPSPVPQVPVTLPTYDEVIGREGVGDAGYNRHLFSRLRPGRLNVLAVHAEVEGMSKRPLFAEFIAAARREGWELVPLASLLPPDLSALPAGRMERGSVPGREGWVAVQGESQGGVPPCAG